MLASSYQYVGSLLIREAFPKLVATEPHVPYPSKLKGVVQSTENHKNHVFSIACDHFSQWWVEMIHP